MNKKIKITEVVLRDAHQSLLATRLRYEDMESTLKLIDDVGYWSVESWGGAIFDSCIRYLGEDPWERIRNIKNHMPNTPQQMLLRGQNLLGYKHYADDLVYKFVETAKKNGVDVFRVFDAMNDERNIKKALEAVIEVDGHAQGTISYTTSPVHNYDVWVSMAQKLQDYGAHSIVIKDMAGLLSPYVGFELVSRLKEVLEVPLHLHSHATTGYSTTTAIKGIEAGLDGVDASISSMSMTYGHSATETIVGALNDSEYETNIELDKLTPIASEYRKIRKKYKQFEGSLKGVDARIITSQVPGGMLTNLEKQLRDQNAIDRFDEVLDEIPIVRKDLGYIPLVTPTSQIVGTQAVINVLSESRYQTLTKETQAILKGEYGRTPASVDKELQQKYLDGKDPITCRPADLISNDEFAATSNKLSEIIKTENLEIELNDENVLIYALFPEIGLNFLKNKSNKDYFEDAPVEFEETNNLYKVVIDENEYFVDYSNVDSPNIINEGKADNTPTKNIAPTGKATSINAPLGGNIFNIALAEGSSVSEEDTVIILEAMKMETAVKTPVSGVISKIYVNEGDKVNPGDPLFEVS